MKVLVTGVCGQLGHDVVNELHKRGHNPVSTDCSDFYSDIELDTYVAESEYISLNLADGNEVNRTIKEINPDAVIHCDSWIDVDGIEDELNRKEIFQIVQGTRNLAKAVREVDAKMVYVSTHYVFSGLGNSPWLPDCEDFVPFNVYGESKLSAERSVKEFLSRYFIVRTEWTYGKKGKSFVANMLELFQTGSSIFFPDDQVGIPTYTLDLSRILVDMIQTDKYGCYHVTNEGEYVSLAGLASFILEEMNIDKKIIPTTSDGKARRPHNCRLDTAKLREKGFDLLPDWKDAFKRYLKAKGFTIR